MKKRRRREVPDVAGSVASIETAIEAGGARLDAAAVQRARAVLERTDERLRFGAQHTVVALVGATGSGKSSLFNALAGMEISPVGPRRPTTGTPAACVWEPDGADALLDWLQVPQEHRTVRESVLDADREAPLHGLVLIDLPDHDSTEATHRLEVDRLVEMVDLLIWVADPQKYADEALHSGYLRRLADHDGVMLVVLNHIDRLSEMEAEECRRDLRRLLNADGLEKVQLLITSAIRGDGVEELRSVLAELVPARALVAERVTADLHSAATGLVGGLGATEQDACALPGADELVGALSAAAGVPVVVDAVAADYRRRAALGVGWPIARWLRLLRADPLARLNLGGLENDLRQLIRSARPAATPAQQARIELAVRQVARSAAGGLPEPWADAIRQAAIAPGADLSDAIDGAVIGVDLQLQQQPWWRVVSRLHVALAVLAVGSFLWLSIIGIVDWLGLPSLGPPFLGPVPLPTLLLGLGVVGGVGLALVSRWLVRRGAEQRRVQVADELLRAVRQVADERVLAPVSAVLADHRTAREALAGV